jgi:hypothetical protein
MWAKDAMGKKHLRMQAQFLHLGLHQCSMQGHFLNRSQRECEQQPIRVAWQYIFAIVAF